MNSTIAENKRIFVEVKELYGHTKFDSFEKEFSDEIIYADKRKDNVEYLLLEPIDFGTDMNIFNLYRGIKLIEFDGWFIALVVR